MSASTSTTSAPKPRKPGVATDEEFGAFLKGNPIGEVVVVDARNPDFDVEPGDSVWGHDSFAPIAGAITQTARPRAVNLVYDRVNKQMDLGPLEDLLVRGKDTPIITHCGGGGRGQKAKVFLEAQGFTNVINGGGPSVSELWAIVSKM